jgi:DNA ligase D-like protein (predicted ligase)
MARDPKAPGGFVAPMLATLHDEPFSGAGWLFERKLDGLRAVLVHDERGTRLYSRNGNRLDSTYPELLDAAGQLPVGAVADGEIVAFDGEQTSFARLQARSGLTDPEQARRSRVRVFLYLFDLMRLDGDDVCGTPLTERKRLLRDAVEFADPIRFSEHRQTDGEAYLRDACARGWEGLIAKRADSRYRPGQRSRDWLKLKCVREQELVVGGYTDPAGSREGFGALLLGYYEHPEDGGGLRYAGKVGTGFDQPGLRRLRGRFDELGSAESPFAERVRERGAHWLYPELVAQIRFTEWTRDGRLRHPRFLGLRTDKPAGQVTREESEGSVLPR